MSAAKTLCQKTGISIDIYLRTVEDLSSLSNLSEFINFAQKAHIVLMHVTDGKNNFPEFDRVASILSTNIVPLFASDAQSDPEIVLSSTVDKKDYQKIFEYLKFGGTENYENLLCFLANHYADGNFEVNPPIKTQFESVYRPRLDHILTSTEPI
jgi:cobalamin biosynthesis Mg chelatase CobN